MVFDVDLLDLLGDKAILQDLEKFTETVLQLRVGKQLFLIGFPIRPGSVFLKKAGVAGFVFLAAVYGWLRTKYIVELGSELV